MLERPTMWSEGWGFESYDLWTSAWLFQTQKADWKLNSITWQLLCQVIQSIRSNEAPVKPLDSQSSGDLPRLWHTSMGWKGQHILRTQKLPIWGPSRHHPIGFFWLVLICTLYIKLFLSSCTIKLNLYSLQYFGLQKAMATHSSMLAWRIPWTEEPGRLQSMGSLGVGHDWVTSLSLFTFMHWRRKWQPTSVFLPGESHK